MFHKYPLFSLNNMPEMIELAWLYDGIIWYWPNHVHTQLSKYSSLYLFTHSSTKIDLKEMKKLQNTEVVDL